MWTEQFHLPDGHRVFRFRESNRWAVADESGRYPEDTDDGILWLDFDRPISITGQWSPHVPVVDANDEESVFITDVRSMLTLCDKFEWNIETQEARYHVRAS